MEAIEVNLMPMTPTTHSEFAPINRFKPDLKSADTNWLVLALPAVFALRTLNTKVAIAVLAILLLLGFARKTSSAYRLEIGPLLLFVAAAGLVLRRPEATAGSLLGILVFVLGGLIALHETLKTDARTVITSFIDGIGVYLLLNVLGYLIGMESPVQADRIGALNESTGFSRIIFPFTTGLDEGPTLAAAYLAAAPLLILANRHWRTFRVIGVLAGFAVAWGGASRTAMFLALALPLLSLLAPSTMRWIAPISAVFASFSALILPTCMNFFSNVTRPVFAVVSPVRDTSYGDIETLSNRALIWSRSLKYWRDHVGNLDEQLLGFGQNGHYRSGVSLTYADILAGVSRNPRRGTLHNSFLQQLFDGGLLGWLLLTLAVVWASIRLSRRLKAWGKQGSAGAIAMTALLWSSTVSIHIAPGFPQQGLFALLVLMIVACQIPPPSDTHGRDGPAEVESHVLA